ncbi:MAG: hypothetical protein KAT00_04840 [Planctomycetes bacterium]|nr:hypothetical protein [Planctomycetota bacterium]
MKKLRKSFVLLLILAVAVAFLYYRSNEEMFHRGLDTLEMDMRGYDGSNPFDVLSTHLITKHYNIHTNLDFERLDYFEAFFEGFFEYFDREVFTIKQPKRLEVFLFDSLKYYRPYAERLAGPNCTPYGFYIPGEHVIVVNADSGLGTITHELTHHFVYCGFDWKPSSWVHEAIASFFEKFIGYLDENNKLNLTVGYFSSLRLPFTREHLGEFDLLRLISQANPPQAPLRSFMMFLHQKGKFREFAQLASNSRSDPYGLGSLEKVYDKPIKEIEIEWKQWVRQIPMDNDTFLVEESFVKTWPEWQQWWSQNKHRLYLNHEENKYHIKDALKEPYCPPTPKGRDLKKM